MANEERGVTGIKASEYAGSEEVFGPDVHFQELPEGIKLFIKGQALDLNTRRVYGDLYRLVDDGGPKLRREHCEAFTGNPPAESYIGEVYGPWKDGYVWMAKWVTFDGTEKGIKSQTIYIADVWRDRHEAYKKKQRAAADAVASSQAPPAPAPVASSQGFSMRDFLDMQAAAEEKALSNIERIARILGSNKQETPTQVMESAYKAAGEILTKAVDNNISVLKNQTAATIRKMDELDDDGLDDEEDETAPSAPMAGSSQVPEFLAPFMPLLKPWIDKLTGGGVVATAAKTMILSTDEFRAIATDPEKRTQAISCFEATFGREKTEKAMKILFEEEKPKATKKPVRGKGK